MLKYEIKHIDVWAVMKIAFLLGGVMGFIFGLFYAIFLSIVGGILDMIGGGGFEEISGLFTGVFGFFMIFFMVFTYAVVGSIMAAILAWLYNLFARIVGGIKVTLNPGSDQSQRPSSPSPVPPSGSTSHRPPMRQEPDL